MFCYSIPVFCVFVFVSQGFNTTGIMWYLNMKTRKMSVILVRANISLIFAKVKHAFASLTVEHWTNRCGVTSSLIKNSARFIWRNVQMQ